MSESWAPAGRPPSARSTLATRRRVAASPSHHRSFVIPLNCTRAFSGSHDLIERAAVGASGPWRPQWPVASVRATAAPPRAMDPAGECSFLPLLSALDHHYLATKGHRNTPQDEAASRQEPPGGCCAREHGCRPVHCPDGPGSGRREWWMKDPRPSPSAALSRLLFSLRRRPGPGGPAPRNAALLFPARSGLPVPSPEFRVAWRPR
jgi:hypothetical protein